MIRALFILLFTSSAVSFAQPTLTATVDETNPSVGDIITLTITATGPLAGAGQPSIPQISGVEYLGGVSTSTNFEIVNGRSSSTKTYTYQLRAMKQGRAVIGPAQVTYRGRTHRSEPITLNILPANARTDENAGGEDVFVRVVTDKKSAYAGEQITLTYKIYFAVQITSPEISQLPRTTGFWSEDIELPPQMTLRDEIIDGRAYKVGVFRKVALFPTVSGDLTVEPLVIRTKVERRAQNNRKRITDPFFGDPFFMLGRSVEQVEIRSPLVKIEVNPLPETDKPANFSGAVGQYSLRTSLDRTECMQHDAVTLQVQIRGSGNIKTLPHPELNLPSSFENYDPKASDRIQRNQSEITGAKTFEYVLIPRNAGTLTIPAINYSYFDPELGKYATASSQPITLIVKPNEGGRPGEESLPLARKKGVESVGTDIAFVKTSPGTFFSTTAAPHQSIGFWILTGGPWIALALFVIGFNHRIRSISGRFNMRRAIADANQELILAEREASKLNIEAASRHATAALERVVSAVLQIETGTLTLDAIGQTWEARGLSSEWLKDITSVLKESDRIRFASSGASAQDIRTLVESIRGIVAKVERGKEEDKPQ